MNVVALTPRTKVAPLPLSLSVPLSLRERAYAVVTILFCIIGAIIISRLFLVHNSLRLDEAQSLWQTSHSLRGTLKVVGQDVHVPLYHVLLHFWQLYIGQSVMTARALSLLFFILSIPAVYFLARRLLPLNWSLLVVVLFSFSPFMNWYANEARMYTLLVLVATLGQYYFLQLIQSRGERGWLGYSLSAMIGIYCHYFFIVTLLCQGIYFLLARRQFNSGTFKRFILLGVFLLLEISPWLYYFFRLGGGNNTSPSLVLPSSVDFFNVFSQFSFGFQDNIVNTLILSIWPILVIAILVSVKEGKRISASMGYILLAGFLPVILAFIVSYALTPIFIGRYMVACVPPLIIVAVWFIRHSRPQVYRMVTGLVLLMLIITSALQYKSAKTPVIENYQEAARVVSERAKAHDVVILTAPFTVYPFDYYYKGTARVRTLPDWDRQIPGPTPTFDSKKLPAQVAEIHKNHQYVYLLLSYNQGYEETIYQYYQHNFERVDSMQLSPGMRLEVYRIGYRPLIPLAPET